MLIAKLTSVWFEPDEIVLSAHAMQEMHSALSSWPAQGPGKSAYRKGSFQYRLGRVPR